MEGRKSNYKEFFRDFSQNVKKAHFVVLDMEYTGITGDQEDTFSENAETRFAKMCQIADAHMPIQVGITLMTSVNRSAHHYKLASYNIYVFPLSDRDNGLDPSVRLNASALEFLGNSPMDFNAWIRDGVRYMSREEAETHSAYADANEFGQVWNAIRGKHLVFHGGQDLFFAMKFEKKHLPDDDPAAFAQLVEGCFDAVYDTAHVHAVSHLEPDAFGNMGRGSLEKWHDHLVGDGSMGKVTFELTPETQARYGVDQQRLHEAGYDSYILAKCFGCLLSKNRQKVFAERNRLNLYKSVQYLDLGKAAKGEEIGACVFKSEREQPLVARFKNSVDKAMLDYIRAHGFSYKWFDSKHAVVVCPATGKDAEHRFAELAQSLHQSEDGITWLRLDEWWNQVQNNPNDDASVVSNSSEEGFTTPQVQDNPNDGASEVSKSLEEEVNVPVGRSLLLRPSNISPAAQESRSGGDDKNSTASGSPCTSARATEQPAPSRLAAAGGTSREQQVFEGILKVFYPEKKYGFIICPETYRAYNSDVWVAASQLNNVSQGQKVSFVVTRNSKGQPQAQNVRCLDHNAGCPTSSSVQRVVGSSTGPCRDASGTPMHGNLYVWSLPSNISENDLTEKFNQFGPIASCKVITDPISGASKGCAFVQFNNPAHAEVALVCKSTFEPWLVKLADSAPGQRGQGIITVKFKGSDPSIPSASLYITGLPSPAPCEQDLNQVFQRLGYTVVRSTNLQNTRGRSESAAIVQLESQEQAEGAIAMLNGKRWSSLC